MTAAALNFSLVCKLASFHCNEQQTFTQQIEARIFRRNKQLESSSDNGIGRNGTYSLQNCGDELFKTFWNHFPRRHSPWENLIKIQTAKRISSLSHCETFHTLTAKRRSFFCLFACLLGAFGAAFSNATWLRVAKTVLRKPQRQQPPQKQKLICIFRMEVHPRFCTAPPARNERRVGGKVGCNNLLLLSFNNIFLMFS